METHTQKKPTPSNPPEFGAHQIYRPKTDAERKAVQCFKALEAQESTFNMHKSKFTEKGIEFGKAIIALRIEIQKSGSRDWIKHLKQLGISYEKARHWIAKVEKKPTDRHRAALARASKEAKTDWEAKLDDLRKAVHQIEILVPAERNDSDLKKVVDVLANMLGYELIPIKKPAHKAA